jgi:hypothetical protein
MSMSLYNILCQHILWQKYTYITFSKLLLSLTYLTSYIYRQPIVTGTSVIALKYKDGIMMAADNLGTFLMTYHISNSG